MKASMRKSWLALVLAALLLLSACTIGKSTTSPTATNTDGSTTQPLVTPTPNDKFADVAFSVDGVEITVSEYNYYYRSMLDNYLTNTYNYGADMTKSLKEQNSMFDDSMTVDEYLHEQTLAQVKTILALCAEAERVGVKLDDADAATVQQSVDSINETAAGQGVTADELVASYYGYGADMELLVKNYERSLLANKYYMKYFNDQTYTDEVIEAEYVEHADDHDLVNYRIFSFSGKATGLAEDATDEEKTAASDLAMSEAKAKAEAMLANISSEADFVAQATENKPSDVTTYDANAATLMTGVSSADISTADVKTYLYSADRKAGDVGVVKGTDAYVVIMFLDRYRDMGAYTIDVRHLLVVFNTTDVDEDGYPTATNVSDTTAAAQAIYDEWLAGDATEDSFATLASAKTEDPGSKETGGLYTDVYRGDMVDAFDSWCFDPARKVGDTGMVTTDYGVHIMYMSRLGDPYWRGVTVEELRVAACNEKVTELADAATLSENEFDRTFVDTLVQPAADAAE